MFPKILTILGVSSLIFSCSGKDKEKIKIVEKIVYVDKKIETASGIENDIDGDGSPDIDTDGDGIPDAPDPNAVIKPNTLVFAGSLTLPSKDGLGLLETKSDFSLTCVTFTEPLKSCKIDVDDHSGKFRETCGDIDGESFGCFVRENNNTIATVSFDGKNSMTAGFGVLSSVIV